MVCRLQRQAIIEIKAGSVLIGTLCKNIRNLNEITAISA